jgi:ParB family transcriptional regulator, chromosome partitioning protein
MEYECRSVALDLIDDADPTFRISFGRSDRFIEASVRHVGLIHAPFLLSLRDRYRIISGFARIAACRRLGWTQIPVRCLPADTPPATCALLAIADNAVQRELNIVEQARSWCLLAGDDSWGQERAAILQSLGMSVNAQWGGILKQVARMPEHLQFGLVEGTIALPVALRLHELQDAADAEALAGLMQDLRLGLNRQRELLDWVQQIALREGLSISDLVNQDPVAQWRIDETNDRGHKAQKIREFLRKRRYPQITANEERYAGYLKKLDLSKNIHLTPPPYFEGRSFQLRIDFQSRHDLQTAREELRKVLESCVLNDILSLPS